MKLGSDCSFQDFAQKGKVGDRTAVVEVIRVQTGLFSTDKLKQSTSKNIDNTIINFISFIRPIRSPPDFLLCIFKYKILFALHLALVQNYN